MTEEKLFVTALLVIVFILACVLAWRSTYDETSRFFFQHAFLDGSGKTSLSRICLCTALVVTTWGLIAQVMLDKPISDAYITIYLTAFVVNGLGSKYIGSNNAAPS